MFCTDCIFKGIIFGELPAAVPAATGLLGSCVLGMVGVFRLNSDNT